MNNNGFKDLRLEVKGKACANLTFIFRDTQHVLRLRKGTPPDVIARYLRDLAQDLENE